MMTNNIIRITVLFAFVLFVIGGLIIYNVLNKNNRSNDEFGDDISSDSEYLGCSDENTYLSESDETSVTCNDEKDDLNRPQEANDKPKKSKKKKTDKENKSKPHKNCKNRTIKKEKTSGYYNEKIDNNTSEDMVDYGVGKSKKKKANKKTVKDETSEINFDLESNNSEDMVEEDTLKFLN